MHGGVAVRSIQPAANAAQQAHSRERGARAPGEAFPELWLVVRKNGFVILRRRFAPECLAGLVFGDAGAFLAGLAEALFLGSVAHHAGMGGTGIVGVFWSGHLWSQRLCGQVRGSTSAQDPLTRSCIGMATFF